MTGGGPKAYAVTMNSNRGDGDARAAGGDCAAFDQAPGKVNLRAAG